jgi:glycine cleavage system H lipoate-binding protein
MNFLPTKGIEYVLILCYLALLVPFWKLLRSTFGEVQPAIARSPRLARVAGTGAWFQVPEGVFFHRGHSWAKPEAADLLTVGMDDFAYGLVGRPDSIMLPEAGRVLAQGEKGWSTRIDGHVFDVLSPVDGEVVEVNEEAAEHPALASADPYERGWLLKVRPKNVRAAFSNLLPTDVARAWMDDVQHSLSKSMGLPDGMVLQDGGLPVSGFARQIGGDHWHELAQEFLLTKDRQPR